MISKFDIIDGVIVIVVLLVSFSIGLFYGFKHKIRNIETFFRKNRTNECSITETENVRTSEYLTANSSMGSIPIAFSLLGSFFSASTLIGLPAEVYTFGIQYWIASFAMALVPLVGAYITGPFFVNLKVMSVFEYFEMRFYSKNVRMIGMISYVVRACIGSAIFIYGPATTLYSLTQINEKLAIIFIGIIGTTYTALGGIKGVIWTDFFQVSIMFLCTGIILIKGLIDIGGLSNLWEICLNGGKIIENFYLY